MSKIMIIVSHIDDEIFSMGGTIHKLSKNNEMLILSICEGSLKFMSVDDFTSRKKVIENYKKYNIKFLNLDYKDTILDSISLSEIIDKIQYTYGEFNPDIVFTHSEDIHPDHCIVSKAVSVITRPKNSNIKKLYHFSIPGNDEWNGYNFKPNVYIRLDEDDIKFKHKFINLYNNILKYKDPHPLSSEKIKVKDEYVGSIIDTEYAEAFELKFDRSL